MVLPKTPSQHKYYLRVAHFLWWVMNESVSIYKGILPEPIETTDWKSVLKNIQSDKYKVFIEKARSLSDAETYRSFKQKLPSVTFGGTFNPKREKATIQTPTGFIIPDLDHLDDVEYYFDLLKMDENIWFAFRSPSGEGIKCGMRATGIKSDEDHKKLFESVEKYFIETYQLKIDPACKDISRLTFVSYDPELFINPNPSYFNIREWTPEKFNDAMPSRNGSSKENYARKVLESCCDEIRYSLPGQQHHVRLRKSNLIGGFCQYIPETEILDALESAVIDSGAKNLTAAMKTIRDGVEKGKQKPITIPDSKTNATNETNATNANSHTLSTTNAQLTKNSRETNATNANNRRFQGNLTGALREYCKENQGVITAEQIDREFGLVDPKDKNLRRQALLTLSREKTIIKDTGKTPGRYLILNNDIEWISFSKTDINYFDIMLPLGLNRLVKLPPKSVIVVAGTSNAGKTALSLEILKNNIYKPYKKLYLMSEMGPTEYCQRVCKISPHNTELWEKNIMAASMTTGFYNPIITHNPNGLTVIDYLEEIDGEYYKITSSIRQVYDAIDKGLAVVNIQKHSKAEVGRGGEGTTEKARLYLTIDTLAHQPNCTISAIKIKKAKDYPSENPNGKEIHVKISASCEMEAISDWMYCNQTQREKFMKQYEGQMLRNKEITSEVHPDDVCGKFMCNDGDYHFLLVKDYDKWKKAFPKIDIDKELDSIEKWAEKNPNALTPRGWFFSVSSMLSKRNEGGR